MPSHFSSIGFAVETDEQFRQIAELAAHSGEVWPVDGGCYVRWAPGAGVELWVQATEKDEIVGVNPFFAGEARMKLGLTERVARPDDWPLDGGFDGFAEPLPDRVGGRTPLVIDTPDARRYAELPLPTLVEAAVVGFAHGLAAWPSEAAFRAAGDEFTLSVGSLVATGGEARTAHARWSGVVRAGGVRENPFSGGRFAWAHLEVPGGELDVVADPDVVDGEIVPGGVVAGTGWLVARITRTL